MVAEARAAEDERHRPFAEAHPFIYGFLEAFASSPPGSYHGF